MTDKLTQGKTVSRLSRWIRRVLVSIVVLATLIAGFYAIENWRGQRAWKLCKADLEKKGLLRDWKTLIPPPVPDESNFFKAPQMSNWFTGRGNKLSTNLSSVPWMSQLVAEIVITNQPIIDGKRVMRLDDPADGSNAMAQITGCAKATVRNPAFGKIALFDKPIGEVLPQRFVVYFDGKTNKELYLHQFVRPMETEWQCSLDVKGTNGTYRLTSSSPLDARAVLKQTEQCEADLNQIRSALERPYAQMDGDYENLLNIPIPNFVSLRTTSYCLWRRSLCFMLLGDSTNALRELTMVHHLRQICESKPTGSLMTLVSAMINVAIAGGTVDTFFQGVQLNVWHEAELKEFQRQLSEINLIPEVNRAFEQAEGAGILHHLETHDWKQVVDIIFPDMKNLANTCLKMMPDGWRFQNMVTYSRWFIRVTEATKASDYTLDPMLLDTLSDVESSEKYRGPYSWFTRLAVPNSSPCYMRCARGQTRVNQAIIVCALERYRLSQGRYPESLEKLVPEYMDKIPVDVIQGQPMHYRCSSDAKTFSLYSVGWNAKDDGGEPKTDWVWGSQEGN